MKHTIRKNDISQKGKGKINKIIKEYTILQFALNILKKKRDNQCKY